MPFAGTWTSSDLLVCRTYGRYSEGGVFVCCFVDVSPAGAAADVYPLANGRAGVAAFSATKPYGQRRGLGQG